MNKLEIFKPEDFNYPDKSIYGCRLTMAEIANAKLNTYLESLPVVYIHIDEHGFYECEGGLENATHTARLIAIEETEKEPCVHQSDFKSYSEYESTINAFCKHCGVKLKATWSAINE